MFKRLFKIWRREKPPPKPPKTEIDQKLQELYNYFKFRNIVDELNEDTEQPEPVEPEQTYYEIIKEITTPKSVEHQHETTDHRTHKSTDFRTEKAEEYRVRYHNYLKSDEWKEKRLTVLKRAAFICRDCRKNKATEIHHETYKRVFNEHLNDLTALCYKCHRARHKGKIK